MTTVVVSMVPVVMRGLRWAASDNGRLWEAITVVKGVRNGGGDERCHIGV
ncbi:peroxisome biogenesis protein 1 isoform X1 [Sesbania bispinosa]|nr:peroxisome biogenesis protein 1 isoform X1 [Sesbania bispinosa]